jgi:23S rRNA A1618 N6-methylase RlmF
MYTYIFILVIGCGASCIYPLLATKTKKWKMLATEIDHESVECARRNVARNDYEEFITGIVCVPMPGCYQQNAQCIWTSSLTGVRAVGCV